MTAPARRDAIAFLVVNADDFGLTDGVSRGILRAGSDGVVTSTSVLAVAPAMARSADALRDSGLGVGCHLALVGEDPPLCPAADIPTVVDRRGRFARSWRQLVPRVVGGRVDPDDVAREWDAQLTALADRGLTIDHLDTHQHVHLLPALAAVIGRLSLARGGISVRVPRTRGRWPRDRAVAELSRRLELTLASTPGIRTHRSFGIDGAGRLGVDDLVERVDHVVDAGEGVYEISTHPGHLGPGIDRYRWGYLWEQEAEALVSPALRGAIDRAGLRLGTFGDAA